MWQLIISIPLKSMEGVQLILSQIWAPRMGSWPPYNLFSEMTQIVIDTCHRHETNE